MGYKCRSSGWVKKSPEKLHVINEPCFRFCFVMVRPPDVVSVIVSLPYKYGATPHLDYDYFICRRRRRLCPLLSILLPM